MIDLLLAAGKYLVEHGGVLGALVVVFGGLCVLQFLDARKKGDTQQARIEDLLLQISKLQQAADPERVDLRRQITELQETRVRESLARETACRLAIERVAHGVEQVSTSIGENTDAIRDLDNLVRRKRTGQ